MAIKNLVVVTTSKEQQDSLYEEYVSLGYEVDRRGADLIVLARPRPKPTAAKKKAKGKDEESSSNRKPVRTEQRPKER